MTTPAPGRWAPGKKAAASELRARVAERLQAARKRAGLTQAAVATQMGVQRPAYARMESGDVMPRVAALMDAARVLGVTLDELTAEPGER